jgi:PAS domain-containing protein
MIQQNPTEFCGHRIFDTRSILLSITGINLFHDPDIQGLLGNYQDITERKQAETEQEKLQAQLNQAQKMESVGPPGRRGGP